MKISGVVGLAACVVLGAALGAGAGQEAPATAKDLQKPAPKAKQQTPRQNAEENYRTICQPCHGPGGKSLLPDLTLIGRWKYGTSTEQIAKVISEGVPGTAMLPNKQRLSRAEVVELARLVRSFDPELKPELKK